ncbi:MAG: NUDIX domain-containing protein [bacterium]|nr:NUDIX domain-containing protein [bacterium]
MSEKWSEKLDLEGKNPKVHARTHHVLFECQEPGVKFPWVQIVQKDCAISAVKVLPIVIQTKVFEGASDLRALARNTRKENWGIILVHEKRPYPALVKDAPGTTLAELPGGLVDPTDNSLKVAALRELWEELGIPPLQMLVGESLIETPCPASAGAQIEGYSIYAAAFRDPSGIVLSQEEPIAKYEVIPFVDAYENLLQRHEQKEQCVDFKSLAAILMLERKLAKAF